jgi:hypothetical protein
MRVVLVPLLLARTTPQARRSQARERPFDGLPGVGPKILGALGSWLTRRISPELFSSLRLRLSEAFLPFPPRSSVQL